MLTSTAVAAIVFAGWLFGSVAVVVARRRMRRVRWHRLFRGAPSRTTTWVDRWRPTLAQPWRSRGASWWMPLVGAGLCAAAGQVAAGPVAAAALGAYGVAAIVVVRGRALRRGRARFHRVATDAVASLAADLRAGIAQEQALLVAGNELRRAAELLPAPGGTDLVTRRITSAAAVSLASGAPLADVLDRLDIHLRSVDRARALAETQAAGARASAGLLAAMPAAGIGLGAAIGVDPVRVLLHTTPGGVALCSAVALQLGGLAWTARLARVGVAA